MDIYFFTCSVFCSIWFIFGPFLIYKFMKSFIDLINSKDLNQNTLNYFKENTRNHYKFFRKNVILWSFVLSAMFVIGIIYKPEIMTSGISNGYSDFIFWIVLFLLVFCMCFCSTALAAIVLIVKIVYDLCQQDLIGYKPNKYIDYTTIKFISKFSNKIIAYFCSGLFFIPFAFYYLLWLNKYQLWVMVLLGLYGSFLFISITIPKLLLSSYKKEKTERFIMQKKELFFDFQRTVQPLDIFAPPFYEISNELRIYNAYCYIKEIKEESKLGIKVFDISTVITYITSVLSLVPIFIALLQK